LEERRTPVVEPYVTIPPPLLIVLFSATLRARAQALHAAKLDDVQK
jgi:hypothetical protein